jgi:hypothetical protein
MAEGAPIVDAELVESFRLAAQARGALGAAGLPFELWEALRLAQSEGAYLRQEIAKVASSKSAGKAARASALLVESVDRLRHVHGRQAVGLRAVLETLPEPLDAERLEVTLALAFATARRRAALDRWIATPGPVIDDLTALSDEARRLIAALRAPAVPPGVDPELFADLREADRLRRRLPPGAELWQVLPLAIDDRAAVRRAAKALGSTSPADDLNAELIRFLEGLLDFQDCFGGLARGLRAYAGTLPMGSYGPSTLELAIGLVLASPEGRSRAEQWLEDPERCRREAALRLEGVIGKAQNYERALRSQPAA